MVRKQVFNPDDVVRAGFQVVDSEGWDQLSARRVADVLGSSTAPVYSNFGNMSELAQAVVQEAMRLFLAEASKPKSGNPFLDLGLGVLDFALAHPRWYEALFREVSMPEDQHQRVVAGMVEIMEATPEMHGLKDFERHMVLKKMSIFTHGLASEICSGGCDKLSREEMQILMEEVGAAVMDDARKRAPRSDKEMELFGTWQDCCRADSQKRKEDHHE